MAESKESKKPLATTPGVTSKKKLQKEIGCERKGMCKRLNTSCVYLNKKVCETGMAGECRYDGFCPEKVAQKK